MACIRRALTADSPPILGTSDEDTITPDSHLRLHAQPPPPKGIYLYDTTKLFRFMADT